MGSRLNYLDAHSSKRRRQIHSRRPPPPSRTHMGTHPVLLEFRPFASLLIRVPCFSATLRLSQTMFFFFDSLPAFRPALQ